MLSCCGLWLFGVVLPKWNFYDTFMLADVVFMWGDVAHVAVVWSVSSNFRSSAGAWLLVGDIHKFPWLAQIEVARLLIGTLEGWILKINGWP